MNTPGPSVLHSRVLLRILAVAGLLMGYSFIDLFFTVEEGRAAVVTRLGKPVREIVNAGPYWKLPSPIERVHTFDRRRRILQTPDATSFTRDKKNIVLSTYIIWHIERPLSFLQSVGSLELAESNLISMILASKTQRIGKNDLSALLSTRTDDLRIEQIEQEIAQDASTSALQRMGIAIDQVGIERIAFPTENLEAVFERMRTERKSEANRLRSEGARIAQGIRDDTHIASQEILRKGREEASQIAADAERQAAELLQKAHGQNPGFYQFWSSLQASKRAIKEKSTLILTTNQLFFDGLIEAQPSPEPQSATIDSSHAVHSQPPKPSSSELQQ